MRSYETGLNAHTRSYSSNSAGRELADSYRTNQSAKFGGTPGWKFVADSVADPRGGFLRLYARFDGYAQAEMDFFDARIVLLGRNRNIGHPRASSCGRDFRESRSESGKELGERGARRCGCSGDSGIRAISLFSEWLRRRNHRT